MQLGIYADADEGEDGAGREQAAAGGDDDDDDDDAGTALDAGFGEPAERDAAQELAHELAETYDPTLEDFADADE